MRELANLRDWHRRVAQRAAALYRGDPLLTEADAQLAGLETAIFNLPEVIDGSALTSAQTATGGSYWMLDYDSFQSGGVLL